MRAITSLLIVLCLALTACGGSDDPADDSAADSAGDTAEGSGDADVAGELDAAACEDVAEAFAALGEVATGAATGDVDPAEVEAQVAELDAVSASLPDEIADDFDVLATAYGDIATTLSEAGIEPGAVPGPEAQAALQELATSLSAPELTEASTNVSTFVAGGCQ